MSWIVYADAKPDGTWGAYGSDYFPRKFKYKKDAVRCGMTARNHGLKNIRIKQDKSSKSKETGTD